MGTTGIGALGAVVKGYVSDNMYLGAQIYDANAKSGHWDIDTVGEGEWLKAIELAWVPDRLRAKTDRIQFTYWQQDERKAAATKRGSGWVVSAGYQLENKLFPFLRFGHSDGGANVVATTSVSAGIEVPVTAAQVFSIGIGWADLSEKKLSSAAKDETVLEASYKLQITKNFSLTPDFQYMRNPANLPNESSNWVAGLRGIWTL
jgi:carbohydrate-selective porin OprB